MKDKNYRLAKRTNELRTLSTNIAKLRLYLEQNEIEDEDYLSTMMAQLDAMEKYRDALLKRILNGYY